MGNRSKDLLQLERSHPSSSRVLGKVKDFIGVISEANRNLRLYAKDKPEKYDIEVLTGNESEYIKMDLMLGIADLHTPESLAAAEAAIAGCQSVINRNSTSSSLEFEGSSEEEEDEEEDDGGEDDDTRQSGSHVRHKNSELQQDDFLSALLRIHQKKKPSKIIELS